MFFLWCVRGASFLCRKGRDRNSLSFHCRRFRDWLADRYDHNCVRRIPGQPGKLCEGLVVSSQIPLESANPKDEVVSITNKTPRGEWRAQALPFLNQGTLSVSLFLKCRFSGDSKNTVVYYDPGRDVALKNRRNDKFRIETTPIEILLPVFYHVTIRVDAD